MVRWNITETSEGKGATGLKSNSATGWNGKRFSETSSHDDGTWVVSFQTEKKREQVTEKKRGVELD